MNTGRNVIHKFRSRWRLLQWAEVCLYASGAGVLSWFLLKSIVIAFAAFLVIAIVAYIFIRPWSLSLERVSNHIDHQLQSAEYSSGLLLASQEQLSGLAVLQQQKVGERLEKDIHKVRPKTGIKRAAFIAMLLVAIGFVIFQTGILQSLQPNVQESEEGQVITFQSVDSLLTAYPAPMLTSQKLTINYPNYTRKASITTSQMNVKAVEGSRLSWRIAFDAPVAEVVMEGIDDKKPLQVSNNATSTALNTSFAKAYTPLQSGYYNFRFTDTVGGTYVSDLHAIELVIDKAPNVEIKELAQFSSFDYGDNKNLSFSTEISDDFGIGGAQIVATVSKGSGESVKFREEKISFDESVVVGKRMMKLSKRLNLDQLKMEVGDELYFYVEASDLKEPKPNITRSETFFAIIKDTITDSFAVDGTLGADLMPDYFRSQRQLIIDTKKLIAEKSKLSEKEFKFKSNELGFDQKALRLKYGQFMGDEEDSGIAVNQDIPEEAIDADDPTAGFRHDHDDENEHNIVDYEAVSGEEEEESPLENYLHNHDDLEESTLFTESLRSKLQQAMAEMWDAELHLRLYTPKNSLPYQYKALKLIQEIKNSARIYVHRIGFDPPPIKEDKRLTGDLKEIDNYYKNEDIAEEDLFSAMRESVGILENRILANGKISIADKDILAKAGEELATIAINEPGKHLKTLQQLKLLTEDKEQSKAMWRTVQKGLLRALPKLIDNPTKNQKYRGTLEKLLIKELQASDR